MRTHSSSNLTTLSSCGFGGGNVVAMSKGLFAEMSCHYTKAQKSMGRCEVMGHNLSRDLEMYVHIWLFCDTVTIQGSFRGHISANTACKKITRARPWRIDQWSIFMTLYRDIQYINFSCITPISQTLLLQTGPQDSSHPSQSDSASTHP
jgi:hypothetical protein